MAEAIQTEGRDKRKKLWGFLRGIDGLAIALFLTLIAVSFYSVFTSSSSESYQHIFEGESWPVSKHLLFTLVASAVTLVVQALPRKSSQTVRQIWSILYLLFCLILFGLLVFSGVAMNNATRWVYILGISIQPSEFFKLGFTIALALASCLYHERGSEHKRGWLYYVIALLPLMLVISFYVTQNFSTALIFIVGVFILLFIYEMPLRWYLKTLVISSLLGGTLLTYLVVSATPEDTFGRFYTIKSRLMRSVGSDEGQATDSLGNKTPQITTSQEDFAKMAVANGGWLGQGLGNGKIKEVLPMAMSDYVYDVMIEETGLIAIIGVPALYVWWFLLVARLARREKDRYRRYILYGIGVFYPFQALVNIMVASGLITTGQPLPFLSAGGSSLISNYFAFAIILLFSRWQNEEREEEALRLSQASTNAELDAEQNNVQQHD